MKDLICVLHINNLLSSGFVDFLKVKFAILTIAVISTVHGWMYWFITGFTLIQKKMQNLKLIQSWYVQLHVLLKAEQVFIGEWNVCILAKVIIAGSQCTLTFLSLVMFVCLFVQDIDIVQD